MDFEHLSLFYAKHGGKFEYIWSNDRPDEVKNYKITEFTKSELFQYTLAWRKCEYVRSQPDFVCMNPKEIFQIARMFQVKPEKYPKMNVAFERDFEFLKALGCDFGKIDAEIHHVLAKKFDFPPFNHVPTIIEGFQEMNICATRFPKSG